MKKIAVLFMSVLMLLSGASCGGKSDNAPLASVEDTANTATESQAEDESEATPASLAGDETESQAEDETEELSVSGDAYPYATPVIPEELSSDPESFQVSLDGNIITLPALYSDFAELGWECDSIEGETLQPGFIMVGNASLRKGDTSLSGVNFINLSDQELPLSECYVYGFAFAYDTKGAVETSVVLPGGLHIGSTIDDITAAYGEPTEIDDSRSSVTKLIYQFSDNNQITFEIDKNQPPYWNRMTIYREDIPEN